MQGFATLVCEVKDWVSQQRFFFFHFYDEAWVATIPQGI
jgi:hypothetical protein